MDKKPFASDPDGPDWRQFVRAGLSDTGQVLSRRFFWIVLSSGVLLTTLAGPFGTFEELRFPLRLVYWTIGIVLVTLLATTLSFIAYQATRGLGLPWPPGALAAALLSVPPHWVLVYAMDLVLMPGSNDGMLGLLPYVAIPVIGMTMLINAIVIRVMSLSEELRALDRPGVEGAASGVPVPVSDPSLLFQRVPTHLGRDIVCLRAQDHYLEVVTRLGSALVLMRLSDAERDLAALRGMRVHRSWWVALDHVADFPSGGLNLTTTTGHTIPVARAQRAALRAALQGEERRAAE